MITETYKDQILGVISCYDRIIIQGTLPGWCFDNGMTSFLYSQGIRIFDFPQFAQPLKEERSGKMRKELLKKMVLKSNLSARLRHFVKKPALRKL